VHALVGRVLAQADAARVADAALIELLGLRVQPVDEALSAAAPLALPRGLDVRRAAPWQLSQPFPQLAPSAVEAAGRVREALAEAGVWQSPHM
jgi:hypothetical protein